MLRVVRGFDLRPRGCGGSCAGAQQSALVRSLTSPLSMATFSVFRGHRTSVYVPRHTGAVAPVTSLLLSIPTPPVEVRTITLEPVERGERRGQAREALRGILAAELREPADNLELAVAAGGKPYLPGGELHFNLSHSGTVACVATSTAVPVGVDVERVRSFRNESGMRRRICGAGELELLHAIPSASESQAALIRLWVRKEAVVKASGEGIVRDLNQFSVLDELVDDGRGGRWRCIDLPSPAPGYLAALAFPAAS